MPGRIELAIAIEYIEDRVRAGDRITMHALSPAIDALDALQGDVTAPSVARSARDAQHWLSQYVAALIDGAVGARELKREAWLRKLTLSACQDLRIAIAQSWLGAA